MKYKLQRNHETRKSTFTTLFIRILMIHIIYWNSSIIIRSILWFNFCIYL